MPRGLAVVLSPISGPADRTASRDDGTGKITEIGRRAPRGRGISLSIVVGQAAHRGRANAHMAGRELASRAAKEAN